MSNESVDCILVHPVLEESRKISYYVMPMGLFSMADYLVKNGYKCRIINMGVEKILNRNFSITDSIKKYNPKVIGIDLHWYVHSFSAIELARLCKECSDAKVILGGYTSSFFSKEIIETFPFIDGIICGNGEAPLLEYLRNLDKGTLDRTPNLTFRRNGKAVCPERLCATDVSVFDKLTYSNVFLMDHWETYLANSAGSSPIAYIYIYPQKKPKRTFYLSFGRGCSMNCSYCSGNANSWHRFSGLKGAYYRPIEMIIHDLKMLSKLGVDTYCVENYPADNHEDFYIAVFDKIRQENLDIGINFGCWHIPSNRFLDAFSRTFNLEKSCLSISPESGSEYVRGINKGLSYSNAQFFKTVDEIRSRGIYASIHFACGLPGETYAHFKDTLKMFDRLRKTGFYLSIRAIPIEPGSEMFLNPQKYGIKKLRNSFKDYYMTYKALFNYQTPSHPLGYETVNFSEEAISGLKIKAYRRFYLRPAFFFNRLSKIKNIWDIKESLKIIFATLIGSTRLLNKVER